nr:hypothetical protein [Tanacetum cinerariifolium]
MLLVVIGLKFGVEYSVDYDDEDKPIPFRRRVYPSCLDCKHITGKNVEDLIKSKSFKKLDDDDAVSLCNIGILQLVLLGVEDRRAGRVPAETLIPDEVEAGSGFHKVVRHLSRHQQTTLFKMGTPINWPSPRPSPRPLQPGSSNWQSQMLAYRSSLNWQPPIPSHPGDGSLCDQNKLERPRREQRPSVYMQSPYTLLPPTTELPKKRVGITKKKCKNDNLSPLNLGNAFAYNNAGGDDIVITVVHGTGIYFTYENVDPNKIIKSQRRQSVPTRMVVQQTNAWIEILIRSRSQNADWTVSKSGTACLHIENNWFMIETDQHIIGTLDGLTRSYPPWNILTGCICQ